MTKEDGINHRQESKITCVTQTIHHPQETTFTIIIRLVAVSKSQLLQVASEHHKVKENQREVMRTSTCRDTAWVEIMYLTKNHSRLTPSEAMTSTKIPLLQTTDHQ